MHHKPTVEALECRLTPANIDLTVELTGYAEAARVANQAITIVHDAITSARM
jgi:hypothetical protein